MKTSTCLGIDTDIMAEVRLRRINLSNLVNSYLRAYLAMQEKTIKNKTELTKEALRLQSQLEKVKEQQALILAEEEKIKGEKHDVIINF